MKPSGGVLPEHVLESREIRSSNSLIDNSVDRMMPLLSTFKRHASVAIARLGFRIRPSILGCAVVNLGELVRRRVRRFRMPMLSFCLDMIESRMRSMGISGSI